MSADGNVEAADDAVDYQFSENHKGMNGAHIPNTTVMESNVTRAE